MNAKEIAFEDWYNAHFRTRGADTKHMADCEDAFYAGAQFAALDASSKPSILWQATYQPKTQKEQP